MRDEIIKELKKEQASAEAMTAHTVRIPKEVSQEIEEFCGQSGIRIATVWRRCILLGWERINN